MLDRKAHKKLNETNRLIQIPRNRYQNSIFTQSQVKTHLCRGCQLQVPDKACVLRIGQVPDEPRVFRRREI
ncbi:hypothetical protein OAV48_01800, partial [bacterium]|nr:hypothetical protein [bacterium]